MNTTHPRVQKLMKDYFAVATKLITLQLNSAVASGDFSRFFYRYAEKKRHDTEQSLTVSKHSGCNVRERVCFLSLSLCQRKCYHSIGHTQNPQSKGNGKRLALLTIIRIFQSEHTNTHSVSSNYLSICRGGRCAYKRKSATTESHKHDGRVQISKQPRPLHWQAL